MRPTLDSTAAQAFLTATLDSLKKAGLHRKLRDLQGAPGPRLTVDGRTVLLFCSNNYLGLATEARLKQAAHQAIEAFGCGATGSRLIKKPRIVLVRGFFGKRDK